MMLPVGEHASSGKDESHVQLCVLDTDTFVRTATKHEVILGVGVGRVVRVEPPFWDQAVVVGVYLGVV